MRADDASASGMTGAAWLTGICTLAMAWIAGNGKTIRLLSRPAINSIWFTTLGGLLTATLLWDCSTPLSLDGYTVEGMTAQRPDDSGWDIRLLSSLDDATSADARKWPPPAVCTGYAHVHSCTYTGQYTMFQN